MADKKEKPKSDAIVLREYFGYKKGETLRHFMSELKALTDEDRVQLVNGIKDGSLNY